MTNITLKLQDDIKTKAKHNFLYFHNISQRSTLFILLLNKKNVLTSANEIEMKDETTFIEPIKRGTNLLYKSSRCEKISFVTGVWWDIISKLDHKLLTLPGYIVGVGGLSA